MSIRVLVMIVFPFVLISSVQASVIISTFSSSDEGWTGIPGEGSVAFFATGGNPGGHIRVSDIGSGGTLGSGAIAPSQFVGDLSAFDNGVLALDMATFAGGGATWAIFGTVRITGGGGATAFYDLAAAAPPFGTWQSYSASLTAAAWGKTQLEWMAILANVTEIAISTDAFNGSDTIGIDNFSITSQNSVIPEPGSLVLVSAGVAIMLFVQTRRFRAKA